MKQNKYPPGLNDARVQRVLAHYENQTEDEAAYHPSNETFMGIPNKLVPVVRNLIAKLQEDQVQAPNRAA